MVRYALIGCAAAGLALSSPAQAEDIDASSAVAESGPVPAAPKVRRAPRKIAVLPPSRPAEEIDGVAAIVEAAPEVSGPPVLAGTAAPLPAQFQAAPAQPPAPVAAAAPAPTPAPVQVASIATLPPLRPSFPTDVPAPAEPAPSEEAAAASETQTGPVPPARPEVAEAPAPAPTLAVTAVLPPERPAALATDGAAVQNAALHDPQPAPPAQPEQPRSLFRALFGGFPQPAPAAPAEEPMIRTGRDFLDQRIAHHARINNVPAALVHRVVVRESRYNPRAIGRGGAMGLMQIKHATARGMGYDGPASGLLDAETNLTYAVKYLAGAYRLSDGSFDRAVQHYARGYYYEAKRRNARLALRNRSERIQRQADAAAAIEQAAAPVQPNRSLFNNAR